MSEDTTETFPLLQNIKVFGEHKPQHMSLACIHVLFLVSNNRTSFKGPCDSEYPPIIHKAPLRSALRVCPRRGNIFRQWAKEPASERWAVLKRLVDTKEDTVS